MTTPQQQLNEIIQHAYEVFAKYSVVHPIEGSPISVTEEMQNKLASAPMREASGEQLYRYLFKTMTTWGTINDFKHYLPRFLELFVNDFDSLVWGEVLFSKLSYGDYRTWAEQEVTIINNFLKYIWLYILEEYPSRTISAYDFLIAELNKDKSRFLSIWDNRLINNAAILHLADTIHSDILFKKDEVISTIGLEWLLDPIKQECIEGLFFRSDNQNHNETLSTASQYLYWIKEYDL